MKLLLMYEALQSDIETIEAEAKQVILGNLDVTKGKFHPYRSIPEDLSPLVKMEAKVNHKYLAESTI